MRWQPDPRLRWPLSKAPFSSSPSRAERHRITARPALYIVAGDQVNTLINIRRAGIQLDRSVPVAGGLRVRRQPRVETHASVESLTNHAVRVANVLTAVLGRFGLRAKWPSNCQERCRLPPAVVGAGRGNDLGRRNLIAVPLPGMSWILRRRGEICGYRGAGQASTLSQSRRATTAC